jgi:hypothetical protein
MELIQKREFSDEKRQELADKGHAMPDGSFPIENITDLHNAIQSIGRSKNYNKTKSHIIQRAKDLEATNILPDDWKITKFFDDVKDLIEKAIGTSSSVDQERDERTVENYVRQSANTNVPESLPGDYTIGGNLMSDVTTEPDPKGNIAVMKDFPTAGADHLVSQETRPVDGATSVSDAPNGDSAVVPNQETIPSSATSAVTPTREGEMNQPEKITKSMTCPDCGGSVVHECYGDSTNVTKAAADDEITETSGDNETVEKSTVAKEDSDNDVDAVSHQTREQVGVKKSIWGGAFSPFKK